jgi:pyroglutamyl-peptidase
MASPVAQPTRTTLVTGFNRFGGFERNPSQAVVEALEAQAPAGLILRVLPTEFEAAGAEIKSLIQRHRPDRILCLGLNARIASINLERVAVNVDDAAAPDNAGLLRSGEPILPGGPAAYLSTLPLGAMAAELGRRKIPAGISNHAGTYVCNHVFYLARHEVESLGLGSSCGFVHLPPLADTPAAGGETKGLSLAQLLEAVRALIDVP